MGGLWASPSGARNPDDQLTEILSVKQPDESVGRTLKANDDVLAMLDLAILHPRAQLAFDAADTIWQIGIERHGEFDDDPEAALLGSILRKAVRARQQRERLIGSATIIQTVAIAISTMHFAKGLEFRSVVVMAC